MLRPLLALLVPIALLAGCSSLLPRGSTDAPSGFSTYAEARDAVARIRPFETRVDELRALGFDPEEGKNVTRIPYPEIVARLVPYSGLPLTDLEPGIRRCVLAASACSAYLFHFERQDRRREGSFLLDFLNIRRESHESGWWFDALVVVSDGTVLFRNYSGQANAVKVDRQINPLGPLQRAGESGSLIR